MSSERAVLFDFGGVLLRQDWDAYEVFGDRHGLPRRALARALYRTDAWRELQTGHGNRTIWREAAIASLAEHCGERAEAIFEEWYSRPIELHEPNIALARALRARGTRIGLLSNAAPDLETRIVDDFGVDIDWNDRVISGSGRAGEARPGHLPPRGRAHRPARVVMLLHRRPRGERRGGAVGGDACALLPRGLRRAAGRPAGGRVRLGVASRSGCCPRGGGWRAGGGREPSGGRAGSVRSARRASP